MREEYDVLIMGGGWAGLCLARQLRREMPELSLVVLDSATEYKGKVGEATVEITGNYFTRRLGLSTYMYNRHLPKNGLRFWFTDPTAEAPLENLSEVGPVSLPPHPAFQIDRARMEADLTELDRADGIEVCFGVKVGHIDVSQDGGKHTIEYSTVDNRSGRLTGRWLIDCAGRKHLLGRKLDLHDTADTLDHTACWGRFRNINDIDGLGPLAFRERAHHTARYLSTNHFTGRGYWIWFIPLSGGTVSVGAVCSRKYLEGKPPLKKEEFLEFIQQNRGAREVLGDGELVDFLALPRLSYRARQVYSAQRWATVGFAAMFMDPYWSMGGDFIAWGNDYITDLIKKDFDPDVSREEFEATVELYDRSIRATFDRIKISQEATYQSMASYNLFHTRVVYETCVYFLDYVWSYMCDEHLDQKLLRSNPLREAFQEMEVLLREQLDQAARISFENGVFYGNNTTGRFESGASYYAPFVFSMGRPGMRSWRVEMMLKIWLFTYLKLTGYKFGLLDFADRATVQDAFDLQWVILNHPVAEEHRDALRARLAEVLQQRLAQEFPETAEALRVEIDPFASDAEAAGPRVAADGAEADALARVQKRANEIWNERRPYHMIAPQIHTLYAHHRAHKNDSSPADAAMAGSLQG